MSLPCVLFDDFAFESVKNEKNDIIKYQKRTKFDQNNPVCIFHYFCIFST